MIWSPMSVLPLSATMSAKLAPSGNRDRGVGLAGVFVADVFHEQQDEDVVLVLAGIHAAAQFVAAGPEGGIEFGFLEGHPLLRSVRGGGLVGAPRLGGGGGFGSLRGGGAFSCLAVSSPARAPGEQPRRRGRPPPGSGLFVGGGFGKEVRCGSAGALSNLGGLDTTPRREPTPKRARFETTGQSPSGLRAGWSRTAEIGRPTAPAGGAKSLIR